LVHALVHLAKVRRGACIGLFHQKILESNLPIDRSSSRRFSNNSWQW
jgi:hypothetical protein